MRPPKLNRDQVTDARRAAAAGEPVTRIARRLDLPYSTLYQAIRGTTWAHLAEPAVGIKHPGRGRRALNPVQVREIRASWAAGGTTKVALGREYQVSARSIHNLLRGTSYCDVPQASDDVSAGAAAQPIASR